MAKLSHPADSSDATPTAGRISNAVTGSTPAMASPVLQPISQEASLQSHGKDNLLPSPPHQDSGPSLFSPADCRALKKILHDVGNSSSPSTPRRLELSEPLSANTERTSSTFDSGTVDENYHLVGNEATDTGYEDEDESMELSDGEERITAGDTMNVPGNYVSRSVSYSNRRLRDSVSTHDEKEKLRYSDRRSLSAKHSGAKWQEQEHTVLPEANGQNTIKEIMSLLGKRALPARPQDLGRNDSDRQPIPDDIKQLNRMRLSMEKVLEDELVEQERATREQEPGCFVPSRAGSRHSATAAMKQQSIHEASDADNEDNDATDDVAEANQEENSQIAVANLKVHTMHAATSSRTRDGSMLLVPNTPVITAQAPDQSHIRLPTDQNVPETPFTKTLSYFRQYKGAGNYLSTRHQDSALPQEIAAVAGIAIDTEDKPGPEEQEESRRIAPNTSHTSALPTRSALADLECMALPQASKDSEKASGTLDKADESHQAHASSKAAPEDTFKQGGTCMRSDPDDTQKQLILYPQHPAFVNAIGMIPATVFWMTAATIVRYTNIGVDLLIEKLRDTYL